MTSRRTTRRYRERKDPIPLKLYLVTTSHDAGKPTLGSRDNLVLASDKEVAMSAALKPLDAKAVVKGVHEVEGPYANGSVLMIRDNR